MTTMTPVETVPAVLKNATDPATIAALVEPDATYVSLNNEDADLRLVMPWCGTHTGSHSILETFVNVDRHREILAFDVEQAFGSEGRVAVLARCTFRSRVMDRPSLRRSPSSPRWRTEGSPACGSWRTPSARPRPSGGAAHGRSRPIRTARW